jgi:serine/threonine-protein kinase
MQKIGRYEILEELGRGSMGAVFKARDPQIGRIVAIKIILTANLPAEENALYRQRFVREAQAAGQMTHSGIVTIHDIAEDETGQPFLVMEYVAGTTLHTLLRPAPTGKLVERFPLKKTLDICLQVAEAMDYAHQRGVVHRDIKPSNIIVTPEGRAKIADFGIARLSGTEATHTLSVTGTPAYMSPEQFRGGLVDKRSDIFSLGAMLYWMSTGEKPFPGENLTQVSFNVVYREPAPPRQIVPSLPADLEVILSRCLAKKPDDRYAAAREVAQDLAALKEGHRIHATQAPETQAVEDTVITPPRIPPVPPPKTEKLAPVAATPASGDKSRLVAGVAVALAAVIGLWAWLQPAPVVAPGTVAPPAATSAPPAAAQPAPTQPASPLPEAATPQGTKATTPAPAVAETAKAQPAASKSGVPPAAGAAAPAVATGKSTLNLECRHSFKEASIEIHSAGKLVWQGKLESSARTLKHSLPFRVGKQSLKVRVASAADRFLDEREIEGEFAAGQALLLEITFARTNLFGGRKLTLKWKK